MGNSNSVEKSDDHLKALCVLLNGEDEDICTIDGIRSKVMPQDGY
jgi:hypothetical protein